MIKSCRYAFDRENPDSGPLLGALTFLKVLFLLVALWHLAYFPGLWINLTDSQGSICPSISNTSHNEARCGLSFSQEGYGFCVFLMLHECCFFGFMFSLMVACIPFGLVGCIYLWRKRKEYVHWRGSIRKTLSFICLYSEENPDGCFLEVGYGREIDETQFNPRQCCGYVARRGVWFVVIITVAFCLSAILVSLYLVYISIPMGYLWNKLFPFAKNECLQFITNTTYSECYKNDICKGTCSRDGVSLLLVLVIVIMILFYLCKLLWSCRKAFHTEEEIDILKGRELEPLLIV